MELRKLEREEHGMTRALWESVFAEDTEAFLDYYYQRKTRDNQIYVMDEDARIRAMLQLNPYRVQVEGQKFALHYIIAVATEEAYRGRGMMRQLLLQAMQDMFRKKEPFTFLMPAAEAIYTPYDFRFVYHQIQAKMYGRDLGKRITLKEAEEPDAGKMAAFARKIVNQSYQVYAIHSKSYYQIMILEQRSERGGVKMVYDGRRLVGTFAYGEEDGLEIREPLFLQGYEETFVEAVWKMTGKESIGVPCVGFTRQMRQVLENQSLAEFKDAPVIMARILHLDTFLKTLRTWGDQAYDCSIAIIDPLLVQNNRIVRMQYRPDLQEMIVKDTEDSDAVLTVDAFTSLIFGSRTVDEIQKDDGVILTDKFRKEFAKIKKLDQIFLNEIV